MTWAVGGGLGFSEVWGVRAVATFSCMSAELIKCKQFWDAMGEVGIAFKERLEDGGDGDI